MIEWGRFWHFFSTGVPSALLYTSLATTLVVIIMMLLWRGLKNKNKCVLWTLLVEYLFIVVCSTVICRGAQSFVFARLALIPFWTYKAVFAHTPGVSVWDIVLNIVLFLPFGALVKSIYPKLSLLYLLLIAAGCSVLIETNQYIFEKGIAQIDDVMHNVLGASIGWLMAKFAIQWKTKQASSTSF